MLTASSATFAQFTNGGSKGAAGDNSDYNKVYTSFNVGSFTYSATAKGYGEKSSRDESAGLIGFNVGYAHGFNLKKSLPLFLELGGEFNFNSGTKKELKLSSRSGEFKVDDDEYTVTFMNIAVPVNLVYRFDVSDKFSIAPYAGLNFKINILGKQKEDGDDESESFFNEDDMGKDFKANRFQLGMNVGVNFIVSNKFSFGYRFQPDFIKYQSADINYNDDIKVEVSTKHTNHFFTFGYIF